MRAIRQEVDLHAQPLSYVLLIGRMGSIGRENWQRGRVELPPSVLPDISPSRGEIGWSTVSLIMDGVILAMFTPLADLPP
jgi:hypothetical protein